MSIKIIFENDTELAEFEAINKGYRNDVIVVIGEKKYRMYITSPVRLQQDFESEQQECGFYMEEPNTLLIKEVSKEEIEKLITEMYQCNYFERLDNFGFSLD